MDPETWLAHFVFTRVQERAEKVRDYFSVMQKLAKKIPGVDEDLLKGIIIRGLQPQIKAFVLQHQGTVKSLGDILEVARVAEVRQLTDRVDKMSVGPISRESRCVTLAPDRRSPARNDFIRGQAGGHPFLLIILLPLW